MKKLVAANWKMNGTRDEARELARSIAEHAESQEGEEGRADIVICPPFPYLQTVYKQLSLSTALGGQDCSAFESGAYTGDVSATMLKTEGCTHAIIGHSERRGYFGETDSLIQSKASQALICDLVPILCVGETDEQRTQGQHLSVVEKQLAGSLPQNARGDKIVIAYEPVWAIGTGKIPSMQDIEEMHSFIRKTLEKLENAKDLRILYGGSVKPENSADIMACQDVDGGLIGGASLKAEDFIAIIDSAHI